MFTAQYLAYLKSPLWNFQRYKALVVAGFRCQKCKKHAVEDGVVLQVHHKTYERLGKELPEDLVVLCKECHKEADTERRIQASYKWAATAIDTYASKKYGDDWQYYHDEETVEDEFYEWLERKERDY